MNTKRTCILLMIMCILLWGCGGDENQVIAKVNGAKLTLEDLYAEIPEHYLDSITHEQKEQFIDRWINGEVLYQEALRRGLQRDSRTKEKIRAAEKNILIAELIQKELESRVQVTEEQARQYYQEYLEHYTRKADEVRASQILVPTSEEAVRIRKDIDAGADFGELAREHSVDPSALQGGDLGYFAREDVLAEVAKFAFSNTPGALSQPIKTEFGYHLIRISDIKKAGTVRSFDLVKEEIIGQFSMEREREELDLFLQELRENSAIKQNIELLGSPSSLEDSTVLLTGENL